MSELDKGRKPQTAPFRETRQTTTRPFDLDDCPPGHDPEVWDLVLAFRRTALDEPYGFQLSAGNRLAYALLLKRIEESGIKDFAEAAELQSSPGLPVWSRIIRMTMVLFLNEYITHGREARGFEQLTDPEIWDECSGIVVKEAMVEDVLVPDPEQPDRPRVRSRRQVRPRSARPRRDRFNGWVPDNPPKVNWGSMRDETIGWQVISCVLKTGDLRPFLRAGMTARWLSDPSLGAYGVFTEDEFGQYESLLRQWKAPGHSISKAAFFQDWPQLSSRDLSAEKVRPESLVSLARRQAQIAVMHNVISELGEAFDTENYDECLDLFATDVHLPQRILRQADSAITRLQDYDYAVNKGRDVIRTGWRALDAFKIHPGQLITIVGRQKAGKSLAVIDMAFGTWRDGWSSVFYTVELDEQTVWNRVYAIALQLPLSQVDDGELSAADEKAVTAFRAEAAAERSATLSVSSKTKMVTIEDIAVECEQLRPHVIFIDGFYFMKDRITGKTATDWEANENLAAELKQFSKEQDIAVIVTTQSQEKQQGSKKKMGIESKTIAGGTGLLKASDLVLGLDREGDLRLLHMINSRFTSVEKYHFTWNFGEMRREDSEDADRKFSRVQRNIGLGGS